MSLPAARGGQIASEILHGEALLEMGAEATWGWATAAGRRRVDARIVWLADVLRLAPGLRVLECGCGTGIFTRRLARFGIDLTAVDLSPDLLREARKACDAPNVTFVQTNLEDACEIRDGAFDAICGVSVLHHLDTRKALPALWNKLEPGGRFAFSEPNLLNPLNKFLFFSPDPGRRRRHGTSQGEMAFRPDELRAEFERAGFEVTTLQHRDFLHPSTPRVLIPVVERMQAVAETTPLVRRISGSLWISGIRR